MRSAQEQLETFKRLLEGRKFERDHQMFPAVVDFVRKLPEEVAQPERVSLRKIICETFSMSEDDLNAALAESSVLVEEDGEEGSSSKDPWADEKELDLLLPRNGYFRRYVEFTRNSEAPLVYHFYCAMVGLAATLNRRIYYDMGYYKIFPPMGIIILGPSGIKKTSAANIVVDIMAELGLTKIYSEKLTPEALIEAMKGENANGLVYAPEMAVFLSKQRYMEGIIPLLTRFMDCPDKWESGTIMRGNHVLRNVAITALMCSTLDWFISNTPEDTFGGGFVARNILVVQNNCPRVQPIPRPGDPKQRDHLIQELAYIHSAFEGEMTRSLSCYRRYEEWYREQKETNKHPEHDLLATYYQRKPDHVQRLAMCLHVAEHGDLTLCVECFDRACRILEWTERYLPGMLRQMFKTSMGADQELVIRAIRSEGGVIDHSRLIRKLGYRMNAQQVRTILGSLKEQEVVEEFRNNLGRLYKLKEIDDGR